MNEEIEEWRKCVADEDAHEEEQRARGERERE